MDYTKTGDPIKDSVNASRAALASTGQNPYTSSGATSFSNSQGLNPTITASSLTPEQPINLPTPTPTPTTAAGISAAKESSITGMKANLDQQIQDYSNEKKVSAESSKSGVLKYLGLGDQALQEKIDATQTPEFKAKKEVLTKANNDIISSRKAQDAEIEALKANPSGLTTDQLNTRINEINSRYAYKNSQLSLTANIALNDYNSAKQDINDLYQLKMEAYQPYINYYSKLAENDQKLFNDSELAIINNYKDTWEKKQKEETENIKANGDAMIKYNSLGAGITTDDTPQQRAEKIARVGGEIGYETRLKIAKDGLGGNDSAAVTLVADPNSSDILSQTGLSMPAFGYLTQGTTALTRMNAADRKKYMDEAANWAKKNGVDVSTFQSQYQALNKTVQANVLRNNQAAVAENEIEGTLANLQETAQDGDFGKLRWSNVAKLFAGQEVNDATTLKYKFHLEQLRNELAMYNMAAAGQIDANGNLRQVTEADKKAIDFIIKDGLASGGITGLDNAVKASREKMGKILQTSIDAQNKQVWGLFGVGKNYKSKNSVQDNDPLKLNIDPTNDPLKLLQ